MVAGNSAIHSSQLTHRPLAHRPSGIFRRTSSFGGGPVIVTNPVAVPRHSIQASSNLRWIVLFLSCMLLFGNYYAYDNPAALNKPLQEFLGHSYEDYQYELNLLYSVYSFPNMFLPFIGGQMVDRMDSKKVLLIFSAFVCIGQTLFAWGVSIKTFWVMMIGRILFGIGGESISVIQASITTTWFKNKELAFALGLNLCIARLGSVVNANVSPRLEKAFGVPSAVWAGSVMCYLSFFSGVLLVAILNGQKNTSDPVPNSAHALESSEEEMSEFNHFKRNLANVGLFPFQFWLVCFICVLLYGTVVPFNNIASDFLMSKWYQNDTISAGFAMSIPDTVSAFLVPVSGYLVDRHGGRATLLIVCSIVIALVHISLGLTMVNPLVPLVFLGISYSIYGVAIWPSIATIIEHHENSMIKNHPDDPGQKLLGTAYGIATSALNTGLTIMPIIAAQVRIWGNSFTAVEIFFCGMAIIGCISSCILYFIDSKNGSILQKPEILRPDNSDDIYGESFRLNESMLDQESKLGLLFKKAGSLQEQPLYSDPESES